MLAIWIFLDYGNKLKLGCVYAKLLAITLTLAMQKKWVENPILTDDRKRYH